MTSSSRPTLLLVDGMSQVYRAYHAMYGLTGRDGRSTNAVYIFTTMLRKLLSDQKPGFIGIAFDLAGPTFRHEAYQDYKANRPKMMDDLAEQLPDIRAVCEALGVAIVQREGFEADDVIGTLARQAKQAGFDVVIVSSDKDLLQLVGDSIRVMNPREENAIYDAAAVETKFGVPPDRVVDVLALAGDPIDNVKGIPGIGEKGARELIRRHGSIDALLANPDAASGKKHRELLRSHADAARQSRELVTIRIDAPVELNQDQLRYRGPDRQRCFELFSRLEFRTLLAEFAPTAETVAKEYAVIEHRDELERMIEAARQARRLAMAAALAGPDLLRDRLVGLAFSTAPDSGWYLPFAHEYLGAPVQLATRDAMALLKPLLEDASIPKVAHDLKRLVVIFAEHGVALSGLQFDPMLASYLLQPARTSHEIAESAMEYLGYKTIAQEELTGKGAKTLSLDQVRVEALARLACEEADVALQLRAALEPRLSAAGLDRLFAELEMPLVPVLAEMEQTGVRVDGALLARQSREIEAALDQITREIYSLAGQQFNINSPKQLSEILFDKLQLPSTKKTGKTKSASTAVDVLEDLALVHDLPKRLLEWRSLQKLKSTYIDALPQLVNPRTGRVHTSFNQAVAATGRLSTSEPNLQNIPIRTDIGREIRRAFIPDPGDVLISADYSQIELRVLAHLSGDPVLIDAFRRKEDIHDRTAREVFGASSGLSKQELRRRAKIINFAILYGKTAFTLAKDIGVPQQAAQEFIDAYFARYASVGAFLDRTLDEARRTGIVRTMFGRIRHVPELRSSNYTIQSAAERMTVNLPIQGTAADIMKKAMIDVHRAILAGHLPAKMILQVHDELLFEAPRAAADEIVDTIREMMEHAVSLDVPLTVDAGYGETWLDAKH